MTASLEVILTMTPGKIWYNSEKKTKGGGLALSGFPGLHTFWFCKKRNREKLKGSKPFPIHILFEADYTFVL